MANCCDSCDTLGLPIGEKGDSGSIIGAVAKILIPSSQILTLNSTPVTLVGAPGIGKAIQLVNWSIKVIYRGVPYATSTELRIRTNTAIELQGRDIRALSSTISRIINGDLFIVTNATDTQLIENKALEVFAPTANPTAGTADIIIYVGYNVISL